MKKFKLLLSMFIFCSASALAQFTTTTATITDSDGSVWSNASVTVQFAPNPNSPYIGLYSINGTPLTSSTYSSYLSQTVTTNSSGVMSVTLLDNTQITPSGSKWYFVIKSNTSAPATTYPTIAVSGSSFSLTGFLSGFAVAPRFPAYAGTAYGYADVEITPIPNAGGFYFNTTSGNQRIWTGSAWVNQGAGSGGPPTGTAGGQLSGTYPNPSLSALSTAQAESLFASLTGCVTSGYVYTPASGSCSAPVSVSPNGTAGGALSGSYPNPTIIGTSIQPKFTNGIGHADQYTGTSVSQQIDNCLSDAINASNGNTTHICDASALAGTVYVTTSTISVGDTNGDYVHLIIPCIGAWEGSMTDGVSPTMIVYGGSDVSNNCPVSQTNSKFAIGATSGSNLGNILVAKGTSNSPYVSIKGLSVVNITGGHATANGVGFLINGNSGSGSAFADATTFEVNVYDSLDSTAEQVENICCGASQIHSSISAGYGGIPLNIVGNPNYVQDFIFSQGSIVGPGSGYPAVQCTDSGSNPITDFTLRDFYTETNNTNTNTPIININGCSAANISGWTVTSNVANNTSQLITTTNAHNTFLSVDRIRASSSLGSWVYPLTAVYNAYDNKTFYTDSIGNYGRYTNDTVTNYMSKLVANSFYLFGSGTGCLFANNGTITSTPPTGYNCITGTINNPTSSGVTVWNNSTPGWGTSLTPPSSAFVGVSDTQTLTNKTISSNQISYAGVSGCSTAGATYSPQSGTCITTSISYPAAGLITSTGSAFGASITAPASAIVGISDSQTLTNKSIAGSEINTGSIGTAYGGLGGNFGAATGIASFNSGTVSVSTVLPTGTNAATGQTGATVATNTDIKNSYREFYITTGANTWGIYFVNQVLATTIAALGGYFNSLSVVNTDGSLSTCTTPPTFNVFDGTTNIGTPLQASSSTQTKGQAATVSESLAFNAGDIIGIYISTAGSGCTASHIIASAELISHP